MTATLHDALRAACADVGIIYKNVPADGRFHETNVEDDPRGRGDGRIKLFPDGEGGVVWNWKGESRTFFPDDGRKLSESERRERDRKRQEAIRQAQDEDARRRAEAASKAAAIWKAAVPASDDHAYLLKKGIKAHGLRLHEGALVIPMRDAAGKLHSLQFVSPDGEKKFLFGGRVTGCYFSIGTTKDVTALCIAEGFATGATIHEATGYSVAVAFNAGNLGAVAKAMRERFAELPLILCADDDIATDGNPGLTKATAAARSVDGLLAIPDFGTDRPGGATDFNDLHQHAGPEAVRASIERAAPAESDGAIVRMQAQDPIATLAALLPIEYDRVRKEKARALGVRTETLDAEVKKLHKAETQDEPPGMFPDVQPWPFEVDGAELLDSLTDTFRRYLVLPEHAATALALWVLFTHCIDKANVAPILALTSPEKQCGKTTVLDALSRLAHKPLASSNITSAALFRAVEAWGPTLLIDEADSFLRDNDELRGVINSGHTRASAFVLRTVEVAGNHEPRQFTTWCAKVIALIGHLPDTITDRSIRIEMQRKLPTQKVEKFRYASKELFEDLRSQCARFAQDTVLGIPNIPESLNDRAADNWEPLLAIADVAGGKWPDVARNAALALSGDTDESDSIRVQLLIDIKATFAKRMVDRLPSAALVESLTLMEERPWPEYSHGKPLTTRQLAKLLRAFSIIPKTIRVSQHETFKGYELESFSDTFARYIPRSDPSQRHNPVLARVSTENASVTDTSLLRIEKTLKPNIGAACDGVTDKKHEKGRAAGEDAISILRKRIAAIDLVPVEVRL